MMPPDHTLTTRLTENKMAYYAEGKSTPLDVIGLTDEQYKTGEEAFVWLQNHFSASRAALEGAWDGTEFVIACAEDMGAFLKVLRSPDAERLFRGLFDVRHGRYRAPRRSPDAGKRAPVQVILKYTGTDMETSEIYASARQAVGWSQNQLAQAAGVAVLTVINIEKGRSNGRPGTRIALTAALEAAGVVFSPGMVSWYPPSEDDAVDPPYGDSGQRADDYSDADTGAGHDSSLGDGLGEEPI